MSNVINLSVERIKRATPEQWQAILRQALKEEDERKQLTRAMLITQGYGEKAINTHYDGANLYGTIWSLIAMVEYGFNESFISDVKLKGHSHATDPEAIVFYVWADSREHAIELLGKYDSGSTGEVNEEGLVYDAFLGEYV